MTPDTKQDTTQQEAMFSAFVQTACASSPLSCSELIPPLAFVLADVAAQSTDYASVPEVHDGLLELVSDMYKHVCGESDEGANITIN